MCTSRRSVQNVSFIAKIDFDAGEKGLPKARKGPLERPKDGDRFICLFLSPLPSWGVSAIRCKAIPCWLGHGVRAAQAEGCEEAWGYPERRHYWAQGRAGLNIRRTSNQVLHTSTSGAFSAVSTPIFASRYLFFIIFRYLQDVYSFAPLQSQQFIEFSSKCLLIF